MEDQPLQPAAWASISSAMDDRVCQSVLGVQLLALPSILPEVPWPDRDVLAASDLCTAARRKQETRAFPAHAAAYSTLCAFLLGF